MRLDDLLEFTRRRPFVPFRLHTTDGQVYEIVHPDQAMPLKSRLVIAMPDKAGVPERTEHISLLHITRIESLDSPEPPAKNGTSG